MRLFSCHVYSRLVQLHSLRFYSPLLRRVNNMDARKVVVTHEEDTLTVGISFRFQDVHSKVDRIFNLQRSTQEDLSSVLTRISNNIQKTLNKKRKKHEATPEVVPVFMRNCDGDDSVNPDLTCHESFVTRASKHYLKIGEITYNLDVNPPIVKSIDLPRCIMAGYLVYPNKFEATFSVKDECIFRWFKSDLKFSSENESKAQLNKIKWLEMATGFSFITENEDIGRILKVVVTPCQGDRRGEDVEAISAGLVAAGPGHCPFHRRHIITKNLAGQNCLRVISYNILADQYADSEFARENLFPSCPRYALDIDYRKQLLIREITGYNGDVICLQEVDEKVFVHDLLPSLRKEGLDGIYTAKGGQVTEGVALFYRKSKLRLLESHRFILTQELQNNVMFAEVWEQVQSCPNFKERVVNRQTALQVSVLESVEDPGRLVVVGGTHLYFHPDADHVRLLQAGLGIQILRQVMSLLQNKHPEKEVALLFAGDFNSTPEFAVYRLMTAQMVDIDDIDWSSKEDERVEGISFSHDLELASACGCPQYTNFTKGFFGCLDYIFYQTDHFSVKQVVEFPSHEEVTEHEFLPSITMPSDHIALIADLEFRKTKDKGATEN